MCAALLVPVSYVVTAGIAGAGDNPVVVENGRRVAHFGVPFRFATSNIDESPWIYSVGEDATWNPWEIPTTFEETPFRRSLAVIYAVVAGVSLLPWALIRDARARRRRT